MYSRYIPECEPEYCTGSNVLFADRKAAPILRLPKLDRGDFVILLVAALLLTQGEGTDAIILAVALLVALF